MPAQRIDGKAIAQSVKLEVRERVAAFTQRYGRAPELHVVLVGDDPASQVYVRNKEEAARWAGMGGRVIRMPADTAFESLRAQLEALNHDPKVDGILLQLPLPGHLDGAALTRLIDPDKDVDGLHPLNAGRLFANLPGLRPCTPSGCMALLEAIGCPTAGRRALVIGRSPLVGKAAALMLLNADATVTLAHSRSRDLPRLVGEAEIVVAAAGRPRLVRGEWLRPDAVVIDVGIHRKAGGGLEGDVDFESAQERASWITPVPGGVGPMTIAMLLRNTLDAAERRLV